MVVGRRVGGGFEIDSVVWIQKEERRKIEERRRRQERTNREILAIQEEIEHEKLLDEEEMGTRMDDQRKSVSPQKRQGRSALAKLGKESETNSPRSARDRTDAHAKFVFGSESHQASEDHTSPFGESHVPNVLKRFHSQANRRRSTVKTDALSPEREATCKAFGFPRHWGSQVKDVVASVKNTMESAIEKFGPELLNDSAREALTDAGANPLDGRNLSHLRRQLSVSVDVNPAADFSASSKERTVVLKPEMSLMSLDMTTGPDALDTSDGNYTRPSLIVANRAEQLQRRAARLRKAFDEGGVVDTDEIATIFESIDDPPLDVDFEMILRTVMDYATFEEHGTASNVTKILLHEHGISIMQSLFWYSFAAFFAPMTVSAQIESLRGVAEQLALLTWHGRGTGSALDALPLVVMHVVTFTFGIVFPGIMKESVRDAADRAVHLKSPSDYTPFTWDFYTRVSMLTLLALTGTLHTPTFIVFVRQRHFSASEIRVGEDEHSGPGGRRRSRRLSSLRRKSNQRSSARTSMMETSHQKIPPVVGESSDEDESTQESSAAPAEESEPRKRVEEPPKDPLYTVPPHDIMRYLQSTVDGDEFNIFNNDILDYNVAVGVVRAQEAAQKVQDRHQAAARLRAGNQQGIYQYASSHPDEENYRTSNFVRDSRPSSRRFLVRSVKGIDWGGPNTDGEELGFNEVQQGVIRCTNEAEELCMAIFRPVGEASEGRRATSRPNSNFSSFRNFGKAITSISDGHKQAQGKLSRRSSGATTPQSTQAQSMEALGDYLGIGKNSALSASQQRAARDTVLSQIAGNPSVFDVQSFTRPIQEEERSELLVGRFPHGLEKPPLAATTEKKKVKKMKAATPLVPISPVLNLQSDPTPLDTSSIGDVREEIDFVGTGRSAGTASTAVAVPSARQGAARTETPVDAVGWSTGRLTRQPETARSHTPEENNVALEGMVQSLFPKAPEKGSAEDVATRMANAKAEGMKAGKRGPANDGLSTVQVLHRVREAYGHRPHDTVSEISSVDSRSFVPSSRAVTPTLDAMRMKTKPIHQRSATPSANMMRSSVRIPVGKQRHAVPHGSIERTLDSRALSPMMGSSVAVPRGVQRGESLTLTDQPPIFRKRFQEARRIGLSIQERARKLAEDRKEQQQKAEREVRQELKAVQSKGLRVAEVMDDPLLRTEYVNAYVAENPPRREPDPLRNADMRTGTLLAHQAKHTSELVKQSFRKLDNTFRARNRRKRVF